MAAKPPAGMVRDGWSETLMVLTRWDLLIVALYGSLVWKYSAGVGYTERVVGRRLRVYLLESNQVDRTLYI